MKQLVCESLQEFYIVESISDAKKIFVEAGFDLSDDLPKFVLSTYKSSDVGKMAQWVSETPENLEEIDEIYNLFSKMKKQKQTNRDVNDFVKFNKFKRHVSDVSKEIKKKEVEQRRKEIEKKK